MWYLADKCALVDAIQQSNGRPHTIFNAFFQNAKDDIETRLVSYSRDDIQHGRVPVPRLMIVTRSVECNSSELESAVEDAETLRGDRREKAVRRLLKGRFGMDPLPPFGFSVVRSVLTSP